MHQGLQIRSSFQTMNFDQKTPYPYQGLQSLCQAWKGAQQHYYTHPYPDIEKAIQAWLTRLAPECENIHLSAKGWYCSLKDISLMQINAKLRSLRHTITRRWKRQPYALVRRFTASET